MTGETSAFFARGRRLRYGTPTEVDGVRFPSKTEASVFASLAPECAARGARIYRGVKWPLLNLAPDDDPKRRGLPLTFSPDFTIVEPDGSWHVVDAKSGTFRSPEWKRGAAAFEAFYERPVVIRAPVKVSRAKSRSGTRTP